MLITAIGAIALAATSSPAAAHDLWEADIALPAAAAPVYVLQLDDALESATKHFGIEWFDVLDAQGRTMPRGFWSSPNGDGPRRDVALALSDKRALHVAPQMCEAQPHPAECASFDRDGDPAAWALSQQRIWMPATAGAGARSPMFGHVGNSGAFGGYPRQVTAPPVPLHWDATDIAAPPAEAADWSKRALVLTWKSQLAPDAIAWQIGYNVASITRGDLASLKENDAPLDGWNGRLVNAWRRAGRLMTFGQLKNAQPDGDVWRVEVPLKGLVGNDVMQIASAPAGAVELLGVHLTGVAPRAVPRMDNREQPMRMEPMQDGARRFVDPWPAGSTTATLRFPPAESQAMMDANILKIEYQALTASGRVKNITLDSFQSFVNSNPLSGISGGTTVDPADPWTQLQQLKPTQALPLPQVSAAYYTHALWFEAAGVAPYHLTFGTPSARRPEQMDMFDADQLGIGRKAPADTVRLPMAALQNVRKTGSVAATLPPAMDVETQARRERLLAMIVTVLATLAFFGLAAIDRNLRRKIAALRRRQP